MKVYKAEYQWSGGMGAWEHSWHVVVANTETEALGLAMNEVPYSKAEDWEISEINVLDPGVTYIAERFS